MGGTASCASTKTSCSAHAARTQAHTLAEIVQVYEQRYRADSRQELEAFRLESSLAAAVDRASAARDSNGKRYKHQSRLTKRALADVHLRLAGENLTACGDFDELHRLIESRLRSIHGVGELMIYDTAVRIGALLGHLPKRIYLHRGTRRGARELGLDWRAPYVEMDAIPIEMRVLEPHEIEDCLCIFRDEFATIRRIGV